MKINVCYKELHQAVNKFSEGKPLTDKEREYILILIVASEGDYYPSREDLQAQEERSKELAKTDSNRNPERYSRMLKEYNEFKERYL